MANRCAICGKGVQIGNQVKRRGMAKLKGGAGRKITGITSKRFLPNLQKIKAIFEGKVQAIRVCVKCIKAGKVKKA